MSDLNVELSPRGAYNGVYRLSNGDIAEIHESLQPFYTDEEIDEGNVEPYGTIYYTVYSCSEDDRTYQEEDGGMLGYEQGETLQSLIDFMNLGYVQRVEDAMELGEEYKITDIEIIAWEGSNKYHEIMDELEG